MPNNYYNKCIYLTSVAKQVKNIRVGGKMIPLDTFLVLFCVAFGLGFVFGIRYAQR
jgi:hypothetical protein